MMRDLLLLVVPQHELKLRIGTKLYPFFAEHHTLPSYDVAKRWLDTNLPERVPDIAIVEWLPDDKGEARSLCHLIARHLVSDKLLVIISDTPHSTLDLRVQYQVRIISEGRIMTRDLPNWLGLVDSDRFIEAGQLVLWPSKNEVTILTGQDSDQWPTVKLATELHTRVLEYLMINARGRQNIKKAEVIMDAVWPRPIYDVKSVQDLIRRIRQQIEPNPKRPIFVKSRKGRGASGYYIAISDEPKARVSQSHRERK